MSFLAKLFINDEERNILNAGQVFTKYSDPTGRPSTEAVGKTLDLVIESTVNDTFLYENMFSPQLSVQGEIVIYKRDGMSPLFRMEFANAYIIKLQETFSAIGDDPLKIHLSIAWGIMRIKDVIHEEYWNPNNPFESITATEINQDEATLIGAHYEDVDGNEIEEVIVGSIVYLVIQSKDAAGKTLKIDLSDNTKDFEYNGAILENDILEIPVAGDLQKIKLNVIAQNN